MKKSRNTEAKLQIQHILEEATEALSHSDIQDKLDGMCNRVTTYRVLDRLVDEGLVHKIVNMNGVIMYAKCQECETVHVHNHIHFSCESCKTVSCLEGVEPQFKLPKGYKAHEINFTVSGICPKCK